MIKYIINRLIYAALTLFIIITLTFTMVRIIPGNPVEKMTEELPEHVRQEVIAKHGLNDSIFKQYYDFWKKLIFERDLGDSMRYSGRSVTQTIKDNSPISARIGIQALVIGVTLGISLGVIAAINFGKWPDRLVMLVAIIGISVPSFVLASLLQYYFAIKWNLFPITGWGTFKHTILPSLALSLGPIARYSRYMRANCIDVLNQDYIMTAKAKGASSSRIMRKHVLRNASLPILTLLGPQVAMIFTGSFIIERIFAIPGFGFYFVSSVSDRDYTMIVGQTIFVSFLYIVSILVVDILYVFIDPRIKVDH